MKAFQERHSAEVRDVVVGDVGGIVGVAKSIVAPR